MNDHILGILHSVLGGGMTAEAVSSRLGGVYPVAKVSEALAGLTAAGSIEEVPGESSTYRTKLELNANESDQLDTDDEQLDTDDEQLDTNVNDSAPELGVPPDEGAPKSTARRASSRRH